MSGGFNLKSVVTVATYPKLEQGKLTNSGVVMLGWQLEPNNKPKKTKKSYGSKKTQGSKKSYKVDKKVQLNGSFSVGAQAKTNDKVGTDVNPIKMSPIVELKTGCSIPLGETDWTVNPQWRSRSTCNFNVARYEGFKMYSDVYNFQNRFSASVQTPRYTVNPNKNKNASEVYFYAAPSYVINRDVEIPQEEYHSDVLPSLSKRESSFNIFGGVGVKSGNFNFELEAQGNNLIGKKQPSAGINATARWTF